ncbi:hypothetical protein [Lysinibacillus cavernae]|uniref:hypothetical protein n=1 Tax=Lysinibacillus cavernae TaxID=2666135 RepID=UPI0018C2AB50|nr:hypothetical protein [Lysinibacillus cavernae]
MKKTKNKVTLLIVVITAIFFIALKEQNYSVEDILESVHFNVENPSITIHSINPDKKDIFTEIDISNEIQQKLIKAFQNAKFEKTTVNPIDYDYRINITLNTGYAMWLDSAKKTLTIISKNEHYVIVNDNDFFSILEKATKETNVSNKEGRVTLENAITSCKLCG